MEKLDFAELHKEKLAQRHATAAAIFQGNHRRRDFRLQSENRYSEQEHKVCNKGTYQRFSFTASGAETAASGRTKKTKKRNARLRFARRSSAPVTKRATHGRRQPPVCAGGLSITSPPRNV